MRQRLVDLLPGRLSLGLGDTGQHLLERTVRLSLEAYALGGVGETEGRLDDARLHIPEPGLPQRVLHQILATQAERAGAAWWRGSHLRASADDRDGDREERVRLGRRETGEGNPPTGCENP